MGDGEFAPPPADSRQFKLSGLTVGVPILLAASLGLFAIRLYSRSFPKFRLWWDDYIIVVAVLFGLAEAILLETSIRYGVGQHSSAVEPEDRVQAEKLVYLSLLVSVWALAFAKTSIALLLLRILQVSRAWMVFSYSVMTFILVVAIVTTAIQLTICRPISAMWDHAIDKTCVSAAALEAEIIATAAMAILTDVILSFAPLLFIVRMPTSIQQKIVVAILMGLGLAASFASVFKIVLVSTSPPIGDPLTDAVGIHFWTILEVQLGILAACIPCLKQPFQRLIYRVGALGDLGVNRRRNGYLTAPDSGAVAHESPKSWNSQGQELQMRTTAAIE